MNKLDKVNRYLNEVDLIKRNKIGVVRKRTRLNLDTRRELSRVLEDFVYPVHDVISALLDIGATAEAAKFQKATDNAIKIIKDVMKKYE